HQRRLGALVQRDRAELRRQLIARGHQRHRDCDGRLIGFVGTCRGGGTKPLAVAPRRLLIPGLRGCWSLPNGPSSTRRYRSRLTPDAVTIGAIISAVTAVIAMLVGGALGGMRGERYHGHVDGDRQ